MSWPVVPLSQVLDFIRGITFKPEDKVKPFSDGSAICMRTKNIQLELDESDVLAVPVEFVKRDEQFVQEGDLLISSANSWELVGKTVRVPKLDYLCTAGGFISILRPIRTQVDPDYLFRFIMHNETQHKIRHLGRQTTNISNLDRKRFLKLEIPLPPLSVQKQIAAALEKADTLRGQCQQMEQELNSLAQSVFLDMFGDPVTNPKGFEMINLGDWAETLAGFAFKSKEYSENPEDTKLCRGINIMPGEIRWKDAAYWDSSKTSEFDKYWMKKSDIVIAMDRPWISTGFKIAQISEADLPSLLLQRVMRIRGVDEIENNYFYHCLNHRAFLTHSNITETTVPHISPKDIKSYRLFKLSRKLLIEFNDRISLVNKLSLATKIQHFELQDNFNSFMQRAFKGELTLKNSKDAA